MSEEEAVILSEENAESGNRKKIQWLKKSGPVIAGIASFLVGLIIFLPLDNIAREMLRYASASGYTILAENISASVFGGFEAESVTIPLDDKSVSIDKSTEKPKIKILRSEGRVQPLSYLMGDKLAGHTEFLNFSFAKNDLKIQSAQTYIEFLIENIKKNSQNWKGNVSISADNLMILYRESMFLKEELSINFASLKLAGNIMNNVFTLNTGQLTGKLMRVEIKGNTGLSAGSEMNLNIIIRPTNEFFDKYNDKNIKELLKLGMLLHEDGRIELQVKGTLSNPIISPVKTVAAQPLPLPPGR